MNVIKIDKIIRSKRRTIALIVTDDASLIVRAPLNTPLGYIQNFVFEKSSWINKKKKEIIENGGPVKSKKFIEDEEFLYLGNPYKLKICDSKIIKLSDHLYLPEKYLNNAQAKMTAWYKQKAFQEISDRASRYSQISGWKYRSLSITSAQKRWGSCGHYDTINFTWRLIMAPLHVVDYVVVHELAHIKEKNHSARFWNKVESVLPDYKQRALWLKHNGNSLNI